MKTTQATSSISDKILEAAPSDDDAKKHSHLAATRSGYIHASAIAKQEEAKLLDEIKHLRFVLENIKEDIRWVLPNRIDGLLDTYQINKFSEIANSIDKELIKESEYSVKKSPRFKIGSKIIDICDKSDPKTVFTVTGIEEFDVPGIHFYTYNVEVDNKDDRPKDGGSWLLKEKYARPAK